MQPVFRVEQVRSAEASLIAQLPPNVLMERAAFGLAVEVAGLLRDRLGKVSGTRVLGLIGAGNNGSDALWALSLLAQRGVGVQAIDVTGMRKPDHTDEKFAQVGGRWLELVDWLDRLPAHDVYLDGIAGLGSNRPVAAEIVRWLAGARALGGSVLAVDLPSGMDADRALPLADNGCIEADVTVTFGALKFCHVADPGLEYCGEVRLVDIGLRDWLPESDTYLIGDLTAAVTLPEATTQSHKYSRGVVNIVAGSTTYPGAGALCARAARWGGAGLVRHVGPGAQFSGDNPAIVVQQNEQIGSNADVYVVGPGLEANPTPIHAALETDGIVVLDAQALNLLATDSKLKQEIGLRQALTILLPHGGEFSRLLVGYILESTGVAFGDVRLLAAQSGAVVYLKGSIGMVATPTGELFFTRRTSEHLATAGSGDVLAGLLGSWLAARRPVNFRAAALVTAAAVVTHSLAAELVADTGEPLAADELEAALPIAIAELRTLAGTMG